GCKPSFVNVSVTMEPEWLTLTAPAVSSISSTSKSPSRCPSERMKLSDFAWFAGSGGPCCCAILSKTRLLPSIVEMPVNMILAFAGAVGTTSFGRFESRSLNKFRSGIDSKELVRADTAEEFIAANKPRLSAQVPIVETDLMQKYSAL